MLVRLLSSSQLLKGSLTGMGIDESRNDAMFIQCSVAAGGSGHSRVSYVHQLKLSFVSVAIGQLPAEWIQLGYLLV